MLLFFFTPLQQGLELVQADPQEVSGAGVEAGAEGGGDGREPAAERGSPSRSRGLGVEEGGDSAVTPGSALQYFSNISSWPTVLISYSGTFMTGAGKTRRRFAGLVLSFATAGDEMELKFKK